jgi:hypothetical protein
MLRTRCFAKRTNFKRCFSTAQPPVIEIRDYLLHPSSQVNYMNITEKTSDLRKSLVPLRLFATPDTGGTLSRAIHFYYYQGGMAERDERRPKAARNTEWMQYLDESRTHVQTQQRLML